MELFAMDLISSCPWANWEPPALEFCEEPLCAWVKTPANAWSSAAFAIVGIVILYLERNSKRNELRGYGLSAILIGILSFFYHASLTRYGEICDLSSMFLIGIFLDRVNMERIGWINQRQGRVFSWVGNIVCTGLLFWIKDLGAPLFFVQCMLALAIEITLLRRGQGASNYKYFKWGFCFWVTAQTIWFLDLKRILCEPTWHWLQGHAVWHILMAGLTWSIYLHYAQDSIKNNDGLILSKR